MIILGYVTMFCKFNSTFNNNDTNFNYLTQIDIFYFTVDCRVIKLFFPECIKWSFE